MSTQERGEPYFSFPGLPVSVTAGQSNDFVLRPFGLYESDLNIDFTQTLRPFLVTEILDCCTRDVGKKKIEPEFFWRLPVGKRIECLVILLSAETGTEIPFTFPCPNHGCNQELEIEISVGEIAALQAQAYTAERVLVPFENRSLPFRRPTGSDQLSWLKFRFAGPDAAIATMVRTLLLEFPDRAKTDIDGTPNELVPVVEQAMEEFDPLVNFNLIVSCFSCGAESRIEIDLEEFSLRRLRQAQLRLLASVHRLAKHYHWSEQQIFSVPSWRRARYLSFIEKENK